MEKDDEHESIKKIKEIYKSRCLRKNLTIQETKKQHL